MVDVIIVTYNGMKWIDKCLGSLEGQPLVSRVSVIDNGSSDGTIEYIQSKFTFVNLIINNINHGFGHSNNQGLSISLTGDCRYVFLLNQDAWVEANTIASLIDVYEKNSSIGILSPIHLRGDGLSLDMKFSIFVAQSENYKLISDLFLQREMMDPTYEVKFVNAAAWLLKKECIQKVGGFAPVYHHYGEDMDYANRVLFHGYKIAICPSAVIHHDRKNVIEYPEVNQASRYLKLKKIWHLIYLTDIRHSFIRRYIKLLIIATASCLTSMFRLRLKNSLTYFREFFIVLALGPRVLSNNIRTKRGGPVFLQK